VSPKKGEHGGHTVDQIPSTDEALYKYYNAGLTVAGMIALDKHDKREREIIDIFRGLNNAQRTEAIVQMRAQVAQKAVVRFSARRRPLMVKKRRF
jgi:hypothetical protein